MIKNALLQETGKDASDIPTLNLNEDVLKEKTDG
jgi:hypothetical protein